MKRSETHELTNPPTLGQLRAIVAAVEGLPDETVIAVRIGFGGGNREGSRPTRIAFLYDSAKGRR